MFSVISKENTPFSLQIYLLAAFGIWIIDRGRIDHSPGVISSWDIRACGSSGNNFSFSLLDGYIFNSGFPLGEGSIIEFHDALDMCLRHGARGGGGLSFFLSVAATRGGELRKD